MLSKYDHFFIPAIVKEVILWNSSTMTNRSKMIAKGMGLIVAVAAFIVLMSLLANMPGLTGEIFSKILGIMFTPFFLEASLAFLGLIAVFWVNSIRLKVQGDEYVEMEINDDDSL